MKQPLSIVIIGAGNLAYHLAGAFGQPVNIIQVFNRRRSAQAVSVAKKAGAVLVTDYKKIDVHADLYLVCVKDEAIAEVAAQLSHLELKGTVVHTSGSTAMSALKDASGSFGVFYPLQTFSMNDKVSWKNIPILVEGNAARSRSVVKQLAQDLSGTVQACSSEGRLKIHLAAVLSCNFSNALYALTFDYMKHELPGTSFDLLKPLIAQTVSKLGRLTPAEAQTGPAKRNDTKTINKHLKLLKDYPQAKAVYQLMTRIIKGSHS